MRCLFLLAILPATAAPTRAVELPPIGFETFQTKTPDVAFDLPNTLACRDVTTAEFRAESPEERLIEIEAPVTLLLYHGEPTAVEDVVVEIRGAAAGLRVHDYAPRTRLASELAEPIELKHTKAYDKSVGASLGGKLSGDVALVPTVSAGAASKESSTETRSKLPPKRAVIVSGALEGRTGVFYKLRRSTQSTLEGERTFRVTFAAPEGWSGGEVEVRCLARGEKRWLFVDQRRVWSETAQPVRLRLVNYTAAKPALEAPVAEGLASDVD